MGGGKALFYTMWSLTFITGDVVGVIKHKGLCLQKNVLKEMCWEMDRVLVYTSRRAPRNDAPTLAALARTLLLHT